MDSFSVFGIPDDLKQKLIESDILLVYFGPGMDGSYQQAFAQITDWTANNKRVVVSAVAPLHDYLAMKDGQALNNEGVTYIHLRTHTLQLEGILRDMAAEQG